MLKFSEDTRVGRDQLATLDGFRATLAIWVMLGHMTVAIGVFVPILTSAASAVDLFMVLSGFLMVYTWKESGAGPSKDAVAFYLRRYFRIAPLFYLLLLFCAPILSHLASMHDEVSRLVPPPWVTDTGNYHPHANWNFANVWWFLLHLTFTYGMSPTFESSSPLPDWSLSLEMQYYALFPLLLVLFRNVNLVVLAVSSVLLSVVTHILLGNHLQPGILTSYGQPSLLPFRLNAFFAGMITAIAFRSKGSNAFKVNEAVAVICAVICISSLPKVVVILFLLFLLLVFSNLGLISVFFRSKPMRFLGDVSYSIYLCHMIVLIPLAYFLDAHTAFLRLPHFMRFIVATSFLSPLVILISYVLYRFVEIPTMKYGQSLARQYLHK